MKLVQAMDKKTGIGHGQENWYRQWTNKLVQAMDKKTGIGNG